MKDKIKWLFAILLGSSTVAYSQLIEKERIPIKEGEVLIGGGKAISFFNGKEGQNSAHFSGAYSIKLAEGEKAALLSNNNLFTRMSDPKNNYSTQQIIKYRLDGNSIVEVRKVEYQSYRTNVYFFPNGGFCGAILDKPSIDFYSNDFEYVRSYTPFIDGYETIAQSVLGNKVLFAFINGKSKGYKLAFLSNTGTTYFDRIIDDSGFFQKVMLTNNYLITDLYYSDSGNYIAHIFDGNGNQIGEYAHDQVIMDWGFVESGSTLIINSGYKLDFINVPNGSLVKSIKWKDLFDELGIEDKRNDYFVNTGGIKSLGNGKVALLIYQHSGLHSDNNFLLSTSTDDFKFEAINIGVAEKDPKLLVEMGELYVDNGVEVIKYQVND